MVTKVKKNASDEKKVYEMYYDFQEKLKHAKPYRIMAINQAGEGRKSSFPSRNIVCYIVGNEIDVIGFLAHKIIDGTVLLRSQFL